MKKRHVFFSSLFFGRRVNSWPDYRGEKLRVIGVAYVCSPAATRKMVPSAGKKKGALPLLIPILTHRYHGDAHHGQSHPFTLGESSKDHGKFHFSLINGQKKYIANCVFFSLFSLLSSTVTGIRVIFCTFVRP